MNTGHIQAERAEKAQQEDKRLNFVISNGNEQERAELVKRWNAYPRLMEALKTIESKLHEGDEEDGSDDGEYIQDVRNLSGDYIGQLQDLGTIARGAIAVAAQ